MSAPYAHDHQLAAVAGDGKAEDPDVCWCGHDPCPHLRAPHIITAPVSGRYL